MQKLKFGQMEKCVENNFYQLLKYIKTNIIDNFVISFLQLNIYVLNGFSLIGSFVLEIKKKRMKNNLIFFYLNPEIYYTEQNRIKMDTIDINYKIVHRNYRLSINPQWCDSAKTK